jgi:hypothetical protein
MNKTQSPPRCPLCDGLIIVPGAVLCALCAKAAELRRNGASRAERKAHFRIGMSEVLDADRHRTANRDTGLPTADEQARYWSRRDRQATQEWIHRKQTRRSKGEVKDE